jgi:tRNA 2-thiouridine synthesizing protein E
LQRDNDGYLLDPDQWDESVAEMLARETGLALHEDHWRILHFMRRYHAEQGVVPDVRHVVDFLVDQGAADDKKTAKEQLFRLFPYGYMQQACKIAGMQRPRAWSTG